jgi:glucose/arabinose dehydrogenase
VDQIGTIHVLGPDGKLREQLFLDLRGRLAKLAQGFDERGVLGLALHPRFKENRKFYVYYSAPKRKECPEGWDHTSHVAEFKVSATDPLSADPSSERVLLQIDEPQSNHNCGRMAFGPDGYLYIGTGDGGNANDVAPGHGPKGNGQDTTVLLGKILRIDVDKGDPYGVPKDNPFADGAKGRPEIYAYGFRNPWGITFDRGGNHELFAADVGQNAFEEVNLVVKGGNYGWNLREGFHGFDPKDPNKEPADAPKVGASGEPLLDPILEYKNFRAFAKDPEAKGISVTGGYVYRGKALPQLAGRYVFADWSRNWALPDGVLFVATRSGMKWTMEPLPLTLPADGKLRAYVVAFGQDADGELYVLTNGRNSLTGKTGKVFKLVPM